MENLTHIIETEDVQSLFDMVGGLLEKPAQLVSLYRYLKEMENPWLQGVIHSNKFQDIWFLSYQRLFPLEILCAYEYDYFSRYKTSVGGCNEQLCGLIDFVLHINYANQKGPSPGVYGREFFLQSNNTQETMENKLYGQNNPDTRFDHLVLVPPRSKPNEWTVFHIRIRRAVFLLLNMIIDRHGYGAGDVATSIGKYVLTLSRKSWFNLTLKDMSSNLSSLGKQDLYNRIREFLRPEGWNFITQEKWEDCVDDVLLRVEKEIPYEDALPFLDCLMKEGTPRTFIYESTPELQQTFYKRISMIK